MLRSDGDEINHAPAMIMKGMGYLPDKLKRNRQVLNSESLRILLTNTQKQERKRIVNTKPNTLISKMNYFQPPLCNEFLAIRIVLIMA